MKIAVFCSGNGSNFQAITDAAKAGFFNGHVALMICDNKDAYAIKRAKSSGIDASVIARSECKDRDDFEAQIIVELTRKSIEVIALAGFMRVLSQNFVRRYEGKILNIHPSLLPSFKGTRAIKDAFDCGVKVTGVTVHFVDEGVDTGPIILQEAVDIRKEDTLGTLEGRIHAVEHRLYPEALKLFLNGKLHINDRKVMVT